MSKKIKVIQSVKGENAFWEEVTAEVSVEEKSADFSIDLSQTYQTWLGFGGALTESATYNLQQISAKNKEKIINAYYHPEKGLGYNFGRIHINSSDFSLGNYDYVEYQDESLDSFSIEHEEEYLLPVLREINQRLTNPLKLLASPWSPPSWMKTNGEMNNGGKLKEKYYPLWATYFVNYIKAMQEKGMDIWAVTVQNEPAAEQVWDSCLYTAEEEKEFVQHLNHALEESGLTDVKIIIWDHNRDILFERADSILSDKQANQAVWGVGNHWYMSEDFEQLSRVHSKFPNKHLIFTEGCIEGGVQLGAWHTGERYARNIIGDMNNWLEAFIDWNIVLDENGGPNHVGNYCDAPVIVDTKIDKVYFNSSFYAIGHFSKWIRPGAKRVHINGMDDSIQTVAFRNKDNCLATVLLNETDKNKERSINVEGETYGINLPAHSLTTLIVELKG